jgi:hypothetical protein
LLGARDSSRASLLRSKKIAPLEWRAPSENDEMLRQRTIARLRDALRIGLNGPDARDFDIKKVRKRLETRKRMVKPQI